MTKIFPATLFALLISCANLGAQTVKDQWVDSVFRKMNESEKIAQLFMVPVSSYWEKNKFNEVERELRAQGLGGLLFTSGHPLKQTALTNEFQNASSVPLLIAMDGFSGLDSTIAYPNNLSIGTITSDSLVFQFGKETGRQFNELGVHLNLSLSANISDNNGIISRYHTFGQHPGKVSQKALTIFKGFSTEGILGGARYFPVQGITVTEIKRKFPVARLFVDTAQALPFAVLISQGIQAIIPASSALPLFYETKNSARKNRFTSSQLLSAAFAGEWLKTNLNFKGLVIVDVRPVLASSKKLKNGEAEMFSFRMGNEMIITDNPQPALRRIKRMLRKEKQYQVQLESAVRKILAAKFDAGLWAKKKTNRENLMYRLRTTHARLLQQQMYRRSIAIARNQENSVPVRSLENRKILSVVVGDSVFFHPFHQFAARYANVRRVNIARQKDVEKLASLLTAQDQIMVAFTSAADAPLVSDVVGILKTRSPLQELIIADLACPSFGAFTGDFPVVITAFNDHPPTLEIVPQIIFGGVGANGILPISQGNISEGSGFQTKTLKRFSYAMPEEAGISAKGLQKIESVVQEAIRDQATPGCFVLVAKDGKVVYQKAFGHLTYEKQTPVTDSTIYDLASVTKVSATLQAIMFLNDRGLIDINKKASAYLPELKNSNKKDFTLKDILTHQAGLWPFLPFWAHTMKDSTHLPEYYQQEPSHQYPLMVADKLFASVSMKDSLWNWIIRARIREKPPRTPFDYRYSDMGFYILQHLAEKMLNQPVEDFLEQNLYEPLGAYTMGYLPLLRFRVGRIAPTENDRLFRKALLIGTVHDQGAAMHGGVAGHAGLFSNATDLAKLGQMLLQEGHYGGYQYYRPETVRLFTSRQFETSRRGLGWDKPIQSDWNSPTSRFASPRTFGHTGFTGTCIWVDPEFNLVYVFLSNRVHPDMTNNKLLASNIRSRIQDIIYQSIFDYCNTHSPDLIKDDF